MDILRKSIFSSLLLFFFLLSSQPASAYEINDNQTLLENVTIDSNLYLKGGTLDLKGKVLTVNGDLIQSGGYILINGGKLIVNGNYRMQTLNVNADQSISYTSGYGTLSMQNENDYVKVTGDFIMESVQAHSSYLSAGTMEVQGDFTQKYPTTGGSLSNFSPTGTHTVKLTGTTLQEINFENPGYSYFNKLVIENPSVRFSPEIVVKEATYPTGLTLDRFTINNVALKLQNDLIVNVADGTEAKLLANSIDLNGHTLTINGDFLQSGGYLYVNGGKLIINGDYRMQTKNVNGDQSVSYTSSNGTLSMQNENDYVKVTGDFVMESVQAHSAYLSAGTMEVQGNFTQKYPSVGGSLSNFSPTGTHTVKLNGTTLQEINFENPGYSSVNKLVIENPSVRFSPEIVVKEATYPTDLTLDRFTVNNVPYKLQNDLIVTLANGTEAELLASSIDLNGYTLTINGDFLQAGGYLYVNGGKLIVNGDYRMQTKNVNGDQSVSYTSGYGTLSMQNENDYVKVAGDFITESVQAHSAYLSAGTMEVQGNFTQKYPSVGGSLSNFSPTGTHTVKLTGTTLQEINFENPGYSSFNKLVIENPSVRFLPEIVVKDVTYPTGLILDQFTINNVAFKLQNDLIVTLGDEVEAELLAGSIDLNGHTLTINGDFLQAGGYLYMNGGKLIVNGDYRMQTKNVNGDQSVSYTSGYGTLSMQNEIDYVKVTGDFVMESVQAHSAYLSAGTMEVQGNFTQKYPSVGGSLSNFSPTGTHTMKLTGTTLQEIKFENPGYSSINKLVIENPSVRFLPEIVVKEASYPTGLTLDRFTVNNVAFKLQNDLIVNVADGTEAELFASSIDLNGHTLAINENLLQAGGYLYMNGGKLIVNGDYRMQTKTVNADQSVSYTSGYGTLSMQNENDYVKVTGDFVMESVQAHSSYLSAGTMEFQGDFTQKYPSVGGSLSNFSPTGTHKAVFSGISEQIISFENPMYSQFNILELRNHLVKFATEIKWRQLIDITFTPDLNGDGIVDIYDIVKAAKQLDGKLKDIILNYGVKMETP